jgi:exodeoxyribonuclease V alpha subunit
MSAQHPIDLPFNNSVMLQRSRRFSGHIAQLAQAINGGEQEAVGRVLTKANSQDIHCISSVKMDLLLDVCLQRTAPLTAYGQSADLFQDEVKPNFLNYLKVFQRNGALPNSPDFSASVGFEMDTESWILEALLEFERFRVLSAINEGPLGALAINASIEKRLQKEGWIRSHGEWYSGRAIMLTRNQHDLGLSNGDVGLVVGGRGEKGGQTSFRAYFLSGSGFQSVSINRLLSVQTAYAMSIHKSQGSEYEHALVVLQDQAEKALTRELLYTGVTRAKKYLSLFQTQPGLIEQAVSMRAKRTSGLARRIQQLSTQAGRTGP